MRKNQSDNWTRNHDMPHDHIMDMKGIDYSDLSESIQKDIRDYDDIFEDALQDGYIDENEEKNLITASFKIAERIKKEHLNETTTKGGGGVFLGVLTGFGLATLAVFGLNQMRE